MELEGVDAATDSPLMSDCHCRYFIKSGRSGLQALCFVMAATPAGDLREVQAASAASTCALPPTAASRRRRARDKKLAQTAGPSEDGAEYAPVASGGAAATNELGESAHKQPNACMEQRMAYAFANIGRRYARRNSIWRAPVRATG